eukprot:6095169-Amphidinium_carterae.1
MSRLSYCSLKADVNCRLEEPWDHSVVDFDSPLGARPVHFAALRGMMQEFRPACATCIIPMVLLRAVHPPQSGNNTASTCGGNPLLLTDRSL